MNNTLFFVGTGRCGTHFTAELFSHEKEVTSHHERYPIPETFERYCQWYDLPVDHAGFIDIMRQGINQDLEKKKFSFESSAYLSFSIKELYDQFSSKIVLLTRHPKKMIESYINKGWYDKLFIQGNSELALGLQHGKLAHHTFSRFAPKGAYFDTWNNASRIVKLAWYWKVLNEKTITLGKQIGTENFKVIHIEDFDFNCYLEIAEWIKLKPTLTEKKFLKVRNKKPGKVKYDPITWLDSDLSSYKEICAELGSELGYEIN
ncbi:MAG: hypothetical protein ACJASR_000110 [Psychroserpens sp.]|jgi:hypothetical protein